MTTLEFARFYASMGLSVIPIRPDGTKAPALSSWKPFQERRAEPGELYKWFGNGEGLGVGIVCGAISRGLEVIDFDSPDFWANFDASYHQALEQLHIPVVRTPSGGAHLYLFRCVAGPNRKLVRNGEGKTLAEIRGEGGYVLAPGCSPACHPSGRCYEWLRPLHPVK